MKWLYKFLFIAVLFSFSLYAQHTSTNSSSIPNIKLSGYGYYMFGQIVSGIYGHEWERETTTINHYWLNTSLINLGVLSNTTHWLTTKIELEFFVTYYLYGGSAMNKARYFRDYKTYLPCVEGIMHWNFEQPVISSLKIESGLLPYTINPEVKTLGNYLFRSTIHPPSVQNKKDYPWADFLGGIAEVGLLNDKVFLSAMLASEFIYVPFFDFTPAFGLFYKPSEVIDIGGAIAFNHAIPAQGDTVITYSGGSNDAEVTIASKWQGTKLDFRIIFDPKPLFGSMDFIEKEELKIYTELAVLGLNDTLEVDTSILDRLKSRDTTELKDITFPENSLLHRMPFMIGINLPTWKILDLLSFELEWFYSPYANDWFGEFADKEAIARQPTFLEQWDNYINRDNFKWAIHIRKSIGNFETRAQFSRDHTIYRLGNLQHGSFEQTMKRPKDWHWFVEFRYYL